MVEHSIPWATNAITSGCVFVLQNMGSDAWPAFFSAFGASIGTSLAPPMSRKRAAGQFVAVTAICALLGVWLGRLYFARDAVSSCACAAILGIAFYPLLNLILGWFPRLSDLAEEALRRRLGLPPKERAP
jgi:hypothetical protein